MDKVGTIFDPMYGQGQIVAYTGTAGTVANVLPAGVNFVWVFCTSVAHVKIGASPTATTADFPVPASVPVILAIPNGLQSQSCKVSAIQSAAGGNLHICPIAN